MNEAAEVAAEEVGAEEGDLGVEVGGRVVQGWELHALLHHPTRRRVEEVVPEAHCKHGPLFRGVKFGFPRPSMSRRRWGIPRPNRRPRLAAFFSTSSAIVGLLSKKLGGIRPIGIVSMFQVK